MIHVEAFCQLYSITWVTLGFVTIVIRRTQVNRHQLSSSYKNVLENTEETVLWLLLMADVAADMGPPPNNLSSSILEDCCLSWIQCRAGAGSDKLPPYLFSTSTQSGFLMRAGRRWGRTTLRDLWHCDFWVIFEVKTFSRSMVSGAVSVCMCIHI